MEIEIKSGDSIHDIRSVRVHNENRIPSIGSLLAQRRRRWASSAPILGRYVLTKAIIWPGSRIRAEWSPRSEWITREPAHR